MALGIGQEEPRHDATVPDVAVRYEVTDQIAKITLHRPHRLNAVTATMVEELCAALDAAVSDDVGAAVLRGAGRAFCTGHDLKEPQERRPEAVERYQLQRIQDVTRKIRRAPFPVIAGVHGYALGAGCEFALGCDLVVAARSACFGFPEVGVGLGVTGGISYALPTTVGLAKAKELVFLGEYFDAAAAHALGLVNFVVDDAELDDKVKLLAETLRDRPRPALTLAKFALDRGAEAAIHAAFETEIANSLMLHGQDEVIKASEQFRARSLGQSSR